jgi:ABC-type glycerol-3-phosphate transport system substrate-binding protein
MYDCGPNTVMIGNNDFPGNAARTHMGPMPEPWQPPLLCGGFAVMSGSKHQEASALLVSWLTSANSQVEYAIGSYEVPIRADAASDPRLKQHPLLEQAAALTRRGVPNPALHEKYAEIEDKLFDAIQATLSGSKTPKQALDDAVARGNRILKNWKPKLTRSNT